MRHPCAPPGGGLTRRVGFIVGIVVCLFAAACSSHRTAPVLPHYDKPQEAEDFERQQRLAWAGPIDPRSKYRDAIEWTDRLEARLSKGQSNTSRWEELGPGNIGGRVRSLVIDPVNPQRMLLGGVSGGIWKSEDGGANWRATGDTLTNLAVNCMASDPADASTIYAGTGEGYFREEVRGTDLPLRGGGIFRSRDFGETWTYLESTESADFFWVNDLVVSRTDSQRIYAATRTGVWRSGDGGATWSRVLPTDVKGGCLDLVLGSGGTGDYLLASCGTFAQGTVYLAENADSVSSTWTTVLSQEGMGRTSLAIAPSAPDTVYALAARNAPEDPERDQALLALFRSDQRGRAGSWTAVILGGGSNLESTMLSAAAVKPVCQGSPPQYFYNFGWYTNVIAVDPVNPMRIWIGGVSLYRSDDGGTSWGLASPLHPDQHNIVFSPQYDGTQNKTMFVTNDGGIYKTTDATASVAGLQQICASGTSAIVWTPLNNSLGVTQLYHGLFVENTSALFAGSQDNGLLRGTTTSGPNAWREVAGGDAGYSAIDPAKPGLVYTMTSYGFLLRGTFSRYLPVPIPPENEFLFITPMVLDPRPVSTLWIAGRQVWRSSDGAETWAAATAPLANGVASSLATSPHDTGVLFVGTTTGEIYRTNRARTSMKESWAMAIPRRGFVSSLFVDPGSTSTIFATYSGFGDAHVWRSTDGGERWSDLDGSGDGRLPDIPVHALIVDPVSACLYIATDLGVYSSDDGGASWIRAGEGLPRVVTKWLAIGPNPAGDRELLAFTHGRGAWRMPLLKARRRAVRR